MKKSPARWRRRTPAVASLAKNAPADRRLLGKDLGKFFQSAAHGVRCLHVWSLVSPSSRFVFFWFAVDGCGSDSPLPGTRRASPLPTDSSFPPEWIVVDKSSPRSRGCIDIVCSPSWNSAPRVSFSTLPLPFRSVLDPTACLPLRPSSDLPFDTRD